MFDAINPHNSRSVPDGQTGNELHSAWSPVESLSQSGLIDAYLESASAMVRS